VPRRAARRRGRLASAAVLRPGDRDPWSWIDHLNGHLGLLVIDGLLTRDLTVLGRTTMKLSERPRVRIRAAHWSSV